MFSFSLPSMLLIGLLLLATSVQSGIEYVTVRGTITCDSARFKHIGGVLTLLPHANIQLKEHDNWPFTDDVINTTITDKNGDFNISGSSDERWGNKFYIEIKLPCWHPDTERCNDVAKMCTNRNCEYFVKKSIPYQMKYEDETNVAKVHVKGRLICGSVSNNSDSAITHQDVRLMEYDAIGPNDQLNATSTDAHGKFEISGSHKEYWGHEFFLSIIIPCWRSGSGSFSDCSNRGMMCNKNICEVHMRVDIPFEYYYTEDEPKKTLDLGEIHMVKNKQSDRKYLNSYCPDM